MTLAFKDLEPPVRSEGELNSGGIMLIWLFDLNLIGSLGGRGASDSLRLSLVARKPFGLMTCFT